MTTAYADITSALTSRVASNITTLDANYDANKHVAWPNVLFQTDGLDDWLQVEIGFEQTRQAALGDESERIDGTLTLSFYARDTAGPDELAQRIDKAHDLFARGTSVTANGKAIRFRTPRVLPIEANVAEWGRQQILCPFTYYTP